MKINIPNTILHLFIPVCIIIIIMTGCAYPHMYHSPNMMSVPMFKQKGEFSTLLAGSFGSINSSFEMEAAASLPGHIGLGGNLMIGGKDNSGSTYEDHARYNYYEGFCGFYSTFHKSGIFEIYAGYGEGNERHTFAYNDWDWGGGGWIQDGTADMKFSGLFIQPDIGIRIKAFEAAFSLRLSRISFREINYYDTEYRLLELQDLESNSTSVLLEPGFTFRVGHDPIKFQIQGVFSPNLTYPELMFEKFRVNFGLILRIGKKKVQTPQEVQNR
jgi:hypothetical protein